MRDGCSAPDTVRVAFSLEHSLSHTIVEWSADGFPRDVSRLGLSLSRTRDAHRAFSQSLAGAVETRFRRNERAVPGLRRKASASMENALLGHREHGKSAFSTV